MPRLDGGALALEQDLPVREQRAQLAGFEEETAAVAAAQVKRRYEEASGAHGPTHLRKERPVQEVEVADQVECALQRESRRLEVHDSRADEMRDGEPISF